MLTGRGWAVGLASGVALVAGRVLGLLDLFAAGAGMLFLLVVALGYVHAVRPSVIATRRLLPARVHAGGSSRVELALVNQAHRRSPVLGVRDPFDHGARWARFLVAPLEPGEPARAAYRLPTDQRGIYDLGPLTVRLCDPFGVAALSMVAAPATRLTVYPRVDLIAPLPTSRGDDPLAGEDHPHALAGSGEDFYALRPYVRGDDLRRVHWPSTARTDELMIRQDEMPWQGRATVVVDTRASTTTPDALELVLSAAASLVTAAWQHRSLIRLLTTGGYDSGFGAGRAHIENILEHLAEADASNGQLLRTLGSLRRSWGGGGLAMITTALAPTADLEAVATLRSRYGAAALVLFERSAWAPAAQPLPNRVVPAGPLLVRVAHPQSFATCWTRVFGRPDPFGPPSPAPGASAAAGRSGGGR